MMIMVGDDGYRDYNDLSQDHIYLAEDLLGHSFIRQMAKVSLFSSSSSIGGIRLANINSQDQAPFW